jgi:hypothetical protein
LIAMQRGYCALTIRLVAGVLRDLATIPEVPAVFPAGRAERVFVVTLRTAF